MNIRNEVEYVEIRVRTNGLPITYRLIRPVMRRLNLVNEVVPAPPQGGYECWAPGRTIRLVVDAESAVVERKTDYAKPLWRRVWEAIRG